MSDTLPVDLTKQEILELLVIVENRMQALRNQDPDGADEYTRMKTREAGALRAKLRDALDRR